MLGSVTLCRYYPAHCDERWLLHGRLLTIVCPPFSGELRANESHPPRFHWNL